jgi:hypothetical protein
MRDLITSLIASALVAVTVLTVQHMRVHQPSAPAGSEADVVALTPHERVKAGFEAASAPQ